MRGTLGTPFGKNTVRNLTRLLWWAFILLPFETAAGMTRCGAVEKGKREKVLILCPDALGDLVVWLDAAREMRAFYPPESHEITLIVNKSWKELAEQTGLFDHVWAMDRKQFAAHPLSRYRFLTRVRREGFQTVINPVFTRDFLWSDAVARLSGAPERVCHHGDFSGIGPFLMRLADSWYTRVIRSRPELRMELERNEDFLHNLGAVSFRAGLPDLPALPEKPESFPDGAYYVLVPGAGRAYRQWPLADFAQIAQRLHSQEGWTGIVLGSDQDRPLGQRLEEEAGVLLQDWTGRTSLMEMMRVIADARLVVSNETSAVHIAAALGTPVVSITGGGHYGRFVPYQFERPTGKPLPVVASHPMPCFGCDWQCIYKTPPDAPNPCIASISVETVWDAIEQSLDLRKGLIL